MQELEPIPTEVRTFVELYGRSLEDVSFPDVDHATLASLIETVEQEATAVEAAARTLEQAREAYQRDRRMLLDKAQRGLGYAKVFAAHDESLLAALQELSIGEGTSKKKKATRGKRRKAPPRSASNVTQLPIEDKSSEPGPTGESSKRRAAQG